MIFLPFTRYREDNSKNNNFKVDILSIVPVCYLIASKHSHIERCQEGAHCGGITLCLGLALDRLLRALGARAGSAHGAYGRLRALHLGAARTRAGRTLATVSSLACAVINNDGILLRHARLQHVLAQVGYRGALRLQHVVLHIRGGRYGRDRGLQNVLAHVGIARALRALSSILGVV